MAYRAYRPRRASKDWMAGAPEWALDCRDAGARSSLRTYTLFLGGSKWRPSMGRNIYWVRFSGCYERSLRFLHSDISAADDRGWAGNRIKWCDIPESVVKAMIEHCGKINP